MSRCPRSFASIAPRCGLVLAFLALVAMSLSPGPASAAPAFGLLQFKIQHNLATPACLATGSCFLTLEEQGDPAGWLLQLRAASDLATLHWDRAVPWLVFDADPPPGRDRVAYYDARLDAPTVAWLDAFAAHFAAMGRGYLAVSLLDGDRARLSALHLGAGVERRFATRCPDFWPGSQIFVDPGTGPIAFDLARSYRNFVLYLARKLGPDYLALMVEANLIETTCPARAEGLYALYRWLHDQVEAELGPGPLLFATLTLPELLGYDHEACYPTAAFTPCSLTSAPPARPASVAACFPVQRAAIDALDQGGRLDVLALSFYPDGLEMRRVAGELPQLRAFPLPAWNAGGSCFASRSLAEPIDPMAAIDRLGWGGPIAIAETSARACATPLYVEVPASGGGTTPWVFEAPGSPASQAAWVAHTYQAAVDRDFVFYVHSFLRDYPPIGTWIAESGALAPEIQALFNTWPCSGLQTADGRWKPEMLAVGLPEPGLGAGLAAGLVGLIGLARERPRAAGRCRRGLRGGRPEGREGRGLRESPLQFDWQSPKRRATQPPSDR
ncbi:hypothetical protein K2X89_17310 [Myxococcota bacterium]|nr:hypothetical protein [Myxococcota bacterium]